MKKIPVIFDCDPGVDDIAAIILAKQISKFDIKAITTVAGNVELNYCTKNGLEVLDYIDWDVPLAEGSDRPMTLELVTAKQIHGESGMGGLSLPATSRKPIPKPAWDVIYDTAREQYAANQNQATLEIIAVGPLTNIGIALAKYPDLAPMIRRIVIMGGAFLAGNTTPAAEFNIYVDPQAAKRVFNSGIEFYLCPLDVTHEAYITKDELDEIGKLGSKAAKFFSEILKSYLDTVLFETGGRGVSLHDPTALLFAADDSCFEYEECFIDVETGGSITRGRTVTDCYSDRQLKSNGFLVKAVDREKFIENIRSLLSCY